MENQQYRLSTCLFVFTISTLFLKHKEGEKEELSRQRHHSHKYHFHASDSSTLCCLIVAVDMKKVMDHHLSHRQTYYNHKDHFHALLVSVIIIFLSIYRFPVSLFTIKSAQILAIHYRENRVPQSHLYSLVPQVFE